MAKTEKEWDAKAKSHMKKTGHPAIGTLAGWTCLSCDAAGGSCAKPLPVRSNGSYARRR